MSDQQMEQQRSQNEMDLDARMAAWHSRRDDRPEFPYTPITRHERPRPCYGGWRTLLELCSFAIYLGVALTVLGYAAHWLVMLVIRFCSTQG